mmetsp:Transcript_18684/g.24070  ORF Transcript_18684/g.24070 Transcript_18684/m.24070 type:complete len:175 (+) Transcript_18684:210-734(+)
MTTIELQNKENDLCVIFLDMDGVMQPFNSSSFPRSTMHALSFILQQVPSAKLVLSSTWRVKDSYIRLIEEQFEAFIDDDDELTLKSVVFYDITNPHLHSERQYEIQDWLENKHKEQQHVVSWVALDDEELLEGNVNQRLRNSFQGHVVKTDSHTGLTMEDAQKAVQLLLRQLST